MPYKFKSALVCNRLHRFHEENTSYVYIIVLSTLLLLTIMFKEIIQKQLLN